MSKHNEYTAKQYYYEIMKLSNGFSTWVMIYAGSNYCNPKDAENLIKVYNYALLYSLRVVSKNVHVEKMTPIEKKIAYSFCLFLNKKINSLISDFFRDSDEEVFLSIEKVRSMERFHSVADNFTFEYPLEENTSDGWND